MKERPIIFSAPMVRAILEGRKTQARRFVKPQPDWVHDGEAERKIDGDFELIRCPYGQLGDRLWVRETWQAWSEFDLTKAEGISAEARQHLNYPADGNTWDARLRPSIHMPRWASRITLKVTSVRVERLQDISEEDAHAEGIDNHLCAQAVGNPP